LLETKATDFIDQCDETFQQRDLIGADDYGRFAWLCDKGRWELTFGHGAIVQKQLPF
jgi:hypothetical protein